MQSPSPMKHHGSTSTLNKTNIRQTFVGTAQYLTPEMIDKNQSGPFSDLWCLGLITYLMFTGKLPWKSTKSLERFAEIQKGKIDYPSKMPKDTLSFTRQLLHMNPLKRLGMSDQDQEIDYSVIKNHKFFKDIK